MKKTLSLLAVFAASSLFAAAKFGTVDMLKLVRSHPNYESNKALLSTTEADYKKKLDGIKADVEKIQDEGKRLSEQLRNPMLAANAKQKIEKDLIDIQNRFLAGQQKLRSEAARCQQDLQDLESRLLKTTSMDLKKRISKFAEANDYSLIPDVAAAIHADKAFDITNDILKDMGIDPGKAEKKDESKQAR